MSSDARAKLDKAQQSNAAGIAAVEGTLGEVIDDAERISEVQDNILATLISDRPILQNIGTKADGVGNEADTAMTRLKRMWWLALISKIFAWIVVAVLAGRFVLSCAIKFGAFEPGKKETPTATTGPLSGVALWGRR
jgi:hypothetical protein